MEAPSSLTGIPAQQPEVRVDGQRGDQSSDRKPHYNAGNVDGQRGDHRGVSSDCKATKNSGNPEANLGTAKVVARILHLVLKTFFNTLINFLKIGNVSSMEEECPVEAFKEKSDDSNNPAVLEKPEKSKKAIGNLKRIRLKWTFYRVF